MNILWFTWKDLTHPNSGGAEVVNEEITKRLVKDGYNVILLVGGYKDCKSEETINGYKVIRLGSKLTTYYAAYRYYKKNLKEWPDYIIEEVNTIPYFTQYYTKAKRSLIIHQLAREVWFYEMKFPFSLIGYILESIYVRLLNKNKVITISNSTKNDLKKVGFLDKNIDIMSMGTDIKALMNLDNLGKFSDPTIVSLGRITSMKKTIDQVKAFESAKQEIPNLKLKIAGFGNDKYFNTFVKYISQSEYHEDIEYLGKISNDKKIELMKKSHIITVTSIKEGWGLIVTEAASQGTPAIVYDIDGLRDSVKHMETGLITTSNNYHVLSLDIVKLLNDKKLYTELQINGWEWSKTVTFEQCYEDFSKTLRR
jgi:glycosyltransferase involved in cell wall biosynthesis